jgi:hypothetical protein
MSSKKSKKPILSDVLSILFWLCIVFVVAWVVMAGGLLISDHLKRTTAALSQKVDPANIPMNTNDPISGKPIMPGITSSYQGHIIGHCCGPSKVEWRELSPEQKTVKIQAFQSSSTSTMQ